MALEQTSNSLSDLPGVLRRRWKWMAIVSAAVLLASLCAAMLWPATYQASGTILIEQQEVPSDLVRSTISSYADQRIQVIKQRVMTTENLLRIIEKYDLYAKQRISTPRETVIGQMRDRDISFKMISADVIDPRSGNPTKATIAFSMSYKNRSPDTSARVANELVSLFLQQNIESRKQRTADATDFLGDEAERLSRRIGELQGQLADFKEKHINDLPELSQLNIQMMNRADDELREVETRIRSLDQQIVYLDAQLAQISPTSQVYTSTGERVLSPADRLKFLRTEYARVSGVYAADHPDVVRLQREIAGLEKSASAEGAVNDLQRQLQDAQTQLAAARQKYSSEHPDVIRGERLVESLSEQLSAAQQRPEATNDVPEPDNPAYIQIKAQREASTNERAALQEKGSALKAQIVDFERRLASTPAVERDYMTLTRDMDNAQIKYREVRQKQMEAEVAQNLEQERKGERFTLIEPPLTPQTPHSPNRLLILVMGFMLALGAAIGTALVQERLDDTVKNRNDLETLLSVPPLAILPWIETSADRAARARARRYAFAGAVSTLLLALVLIHYSYRPLDVLWQVALRRVAG